MVYAKVVTLWWVNVATVYGGERRKRCSSKTQFYGLRQGLAALNLKGL